MQYLCGDIGTNDASSVVPDCGGIGGQRRIDRG